VRRAERLEMLDEVEEWRLIQAHYCLAWGVNQGPEPGQEHGPGQALGLGHEQDSGESRAGGEVGGSGGGVEKGGLFSAISQWLTRQ